MPRDADFCLAVLLVALALLLWPAPSTPLPAPPVPPATGWPDLTHAVCTTDLDCAQRDARLAAKAGRALEPEE